MTNVTVAGILGLEETIEVMVSLAPMGTQLRAMREHLRISLRRMAEEMSKDGYAVDHTTISLIETGNRPMPADFLGAYAKTLVRIWEEDGRILGQHVRRSQ